MFFKKNLFTFFSFVKEKFGGKPCVGNLTDTRVCNIENCTTTTPRILTLPPTVEQTFSTTLFNSKTTFSSTQTSFSSVLNRMLGNSIVKDNSVDDEDSDDYTGVIVGLLVGSLCLFLLGAVLIFYFTKGIGLYLFF